MKEFERSVAMGLRVVNVASSYNGVYVGAPVYHAFWQSVEEAKCMASMIYEGVMTKFPALKVVMAHGGGYFPHYMGRLDRNTANRPDTVRHTGGRTPSDFLRSFYYETTVYDPQVMGSDYPVGEPDPVGWLRQSGLAGDALSAVTGGNAVRLLGL
jgi:aminocarboxymuconate-semialdehyde decarboxylase